MPGPLRILALVLMLAAPVAAQGRERHDEARERWSRMSATERAEIERRFEVLQKMDVAERRGLEERMARMREWKQRTRDRLPAEMRTRLDRLAPAKREEIVTELMQEDASQRGRDLLDRLPAEWRERLERATPEERKNVLRELKERNRGPQMERAFERLGEELSLSDEEVRRLKSLPREEREHALLDLNRRSLDRKIRARGLPEWMTEQEWKEWQRLPPREFHERIQARRREAGADGGPARGRVAAQDGESKLKGLMRPDAKLRLDLQHLSKAERRAEIERRMKERALQFLERSDGVVTPEEFERLRSLNGREFQDALRKLRGSVQRDDRRGGRPGGGEGRPGGREGRTPRGGR